MPRQHLLLSALLLLPLVPISAQTAPAYRYSRVGNPANIAVNPRPAFALMGGGADLDEAFHFLCDRGAGGIVASGQPLTFGPYAVQKVAPGHTLNLATWTGDATPYTLSVEAGAVHSTQPGNVLY